MKTLLLLSALIAAAPEAELVTVDDQTLSGRVNQINSEGFLLETSEGNRTVPLDQVLVARVGETGEAPAMPSGEATIHVAGGGELSCSELLVQDRRVKAKLVAGGETLDLPLAAVTAIRFRPLEPALAEAWADVAASSPTRDILVARSGDVLDRVEGTVSGLDEESLTFLVGESRVAIGRDKERLFGVVLAHTAGQSTTNLCDVRLQNGDWLSTSQIGWDGTVLSLTSASGVAVTLPWEAVKEFDFGSGKVRYLSDLEPTELKHSSFLGGELDQVFDIRRDRSDAGPEVPIRIDGRTFRKGLVVHSRTVVNYRLGREYRRFVAVAGIEDLVRPLGSVEVTISLDGKPVFKEVITGSGPNVPVDLDVSGVRDMVIMVDFAEDWDIGDHLALGDARLIQ